MKLIEINTDAIAFFKKRINKYLGIADIVSPYKEKNVEVHIHDPGRLGEILFENNKILLKYVEKPSRKTKWDVIAGLVDENYVLIHSNYHRKIAEKILEKELLFSMSNVIKIKPEAKYNNSKIDFLLTLNNNEQIWIETKGCTLVKNNIALFPDAPTKRGVKHIKSLLEIQKGKGTSKLIILIFNHTATFFSPNKEKDTDFYNIFYKAAKEIEIYPVTLEFKNNSINFIQKIPVLPEKS